MVHNGPSYDGVSGRAKRTSVVELKLCETTLPENVVVFTLVAEPGFDVPARIVVKVHYLRDTLRVLPV